MREREAHDSAFGLRRALKWHEVFLPQFVRRALSGRRLLWRQLRLPLMRVAFRNNSNNEEFPSAGVCAVETRTPGRGLK